MMLPEKSASLLNHQWQENCRFFEYSSAANPCMPDILIDFFPAKTHQIGETRTIPLDLSRQLQTPYPATGPSLLANFVHIALGDTHVTETHASRQEAHRHNSIALDYAVKAHADTYTLIGRTVDALGNIVDPIRADWQEGGVFVTPPGWWHSHHNESDLGAVLLLRHCTPYVSVMIAVRANEKRAVLW